MHRIVFSAATGRRLLASITLLVDSKIGKSLAHKCFVRRSICRAHTWQPFEKLDIRVTTQDIFRFKLKAVGIG